MNAQKSTFLNDADRCRRLELIQRTKKQSTNTAKKRSLEDVLREAYRSEINVTITSFWDCGFHVALICPMEFGVLPMDQVDQIAPETRKGVPGPWREVATVADLAETIHAMILEQYPTSKYAIERRVQ